jgi:hypothetical protein
MIRRLWDMLQRRVSDQPASRQFRPNELRLDVVREERLRRESRQFAPRANGSQLSLEERRPRRNLAEEPLAARASTSPRPVVSLKSRTALRQAILLKEVLDPPLALRGAMTPRRVDQ